MSDKSTRDSVMDKPLSAELERVNFGDPAMRKLYLHLSKAGKGAYRENYLLSNAVYSKSDLPLETLNSYLTGKEPEKVSFLFKIKKVLHYFVKSFSWLLLRLFQGLVHQLSGQKFIPDSSKSLTIIDIPIMPSHIIKDQDLVDRYFPRLEDRLKLKGINYAYVPKFFGSETLQLCYQIFYLLKKNKRPVIFDLQLLGVFDYLKMFKFILVYPFQVLNKISQRCHSREDRILRNLLWETMDHATVKNYARQLFGMRISQFNIPSIRCVSWFENQPQDKNFFKGLKAFQRKVSIYGAQLYNWPGTLLNHYVDESQSEFGFMPDRMIVNGTYYLRGEGFLDYKVGPSMRYTRLFETEIYSPKKTSLLILMPIFEYEIKKILKIIQEAALTQEVLIKFHPSTDSGKYLKYLQGKVGIVEGDIYTFFNQVECVIGKATGALVEAASLGIPIINIETGSGLSHNYMPQFGKEVIWGSASTGAEIRDWIGKFHNFLLTEPEKIRYIACKYKEMFFCEPTDKGIDEAFDLDRTGKTQL
jgi:hypothetical protein